MERCYQVPRGLLKFLNDQDRLDRERDVSLTWERVHSIGSARVASLLAAKRGVDVELSHGAGARRDFGRSVTGKQADHAENGYGPAKDFLKKVGLFSEKEIEEVCQAVKNPSRKEAVGTRLEEIAKDAGILDSYYLGLPPK